MPPALPPIRAIADIEALERVRLEERNDLWTVYELIARGAAIDPAKPAFLNLPDGSLEDEPETITFGQLLEGMHRAANLFHSLGIGTTDAVAILLPIVPQNFFSLLGAIAAGIAFPINWMLRPEQIVSLLNATRASVLVALGPTPGFDIWERITALRDRAPGLRHVLQVKGPRGRTEEAWDFDALCARRSGTRLEFDRVIDPADVALYVHTGGTTGMPKIAQLAHRAIAYKCWAYSVLLAQEPRHCGFAAHPLFHIGGIVHHTMSYLARGATSVILGPMGFRAKNVIRDYWKLVERFRITDLGGVPTTLGALAEVPVDADVSSLRPYAMTGSAGLPVRVSRYFQDRIGVRILSNYGMTENTATIALPPRDGDPKFGSSGLRFPYTRLRTVVIDEAGRIRRDCRSNEIGEIIIDGPGVIPGYLEPLLNAKLFVENGWLRTGDLGRLDEDSYVWVTGRAKDVIIRGGHNIDPMVIEEALTAHAAVALAAAVGKPDSYAGELPIAFVQLKPGAETGENELKEFARARVPERAAAPVEVTILDSMPLTAVGKIFRPELRERAALRVFSELLRSIVPADVDARLSIDPHPVHGALVKVRLYRVGGACDRALELRIRSALDRFTQSYELSWHAIGTKPD